MSFAEIVASLMPRASDLADLVAFRSVADFRQFPVEESRQAVQWVVNALRAEGFRDVAAIDTPDGTQSVYGSLAGPADAPTVLLYAHYDVQPPLDEAAWGSPPFMLTERNGRWYGRGAADCKGGLLAAIRALAAKGGVPLNVKVIVEGSEEVATGGLERYAEAHPDLLAADVLVIGDTGNFRLGVPTATASLRGLALIEVTVETLQGNLHSGLFGGAAPDSLAALIRLLGSLYDESGAVAVPGLNGNQTRHGLDYPEADFRSDAKILDGLQLAGRGSVADRLWARPSLAVIGIDCPPVISSTASLQASARARLALRIPPGTDAYQAVRALVDHLQESAPWGARVTVEEKGVGQPFLADTAKPAYQALGQAMRESYGTDMCIAGMGAAIPLCSTLAVLPGIQELWFSGSVG